MRAFTCGHCGQLVFFENSLCLRCSTPLGFAPWLLDLVTRDPAHPEWVGLVQCANAGRAHCNWMLAPDDPGPLCRSCRLTRTRPADRDADTFDDSADKCPDQAENFNGVEDEDGCPDEIPDRV